MTNAVLNLAREVKATVRFVHLNGQHGPYAKARVARMGEVTFQLSDSVWRSHKVPISVAYVIISGFQRKNSGWIVTSARLYTPADEKRERQQHSNKVNGDDR